MFTNRGEIFVSIGDVPNVVNAITGTTVSSLTTRMRDEVEKEVNKVRGKVFHLLAAKTVGRSRTPNLGPDTPPSWQRLSKATVKKKGHHRFYEHKGFMRDTLRSMSDPNGILGPSSVIIAQQGARILPSNRTRSGYSVRSVGEWDLDPFGDGQQAINLRTGRLVKAFGIIQSQLDVAPFANIADLRNNYLAVEEVFGPGTPGASVGVFDGKRVIPLAYILQNYMGGHHRAVLGWYFNWFIRTEVGKAIEKGLNRAHRTYENREMKRLAAKYPRRKTPSTFNPDYFGM